MLTLGPADLIAASTTNATTVNATIMGLATDTSVPPVAQTFDVLYQGQVASSMTAMYTAGGSTTVLISAVHLYNTGAQQVVTVAINGTAGSNTIATLTIPASGYATYEDGNSWTVYSATGLVVGVAGAPGGVGSINTSAQALTASSANLLTGTSVALTTNQLVVGSRYRFMIGLIKTTAAGVATWTAAVKFGTANTTADAAIATWTSATNTGVIDQATLTIEMVVTALGAAATATCIAMYVNSLTTVTGLGSIGAAPGSTATFTSTSTSPFLHVDITPGASAVMTGWGTAERLV